MSRPGEGCWGGVCRWQQWGGVRWGVRGRMAVVRGQGQRAGGHVGGGGGTRGWEARR